MSMLRFFISSAAAFLVVTSVLSKEGDHKVYIKAHQCNASEKFVFKNLTCFAKSYSRNFSGVNIAGYTTKPLYDIGITFKLYFKYGTIYREVLTTPKIDVCSLNKLFKKDKTLVNRWAAAIVDMIEDTAPGTLHECPYNSIIVKNASLNTVSLPSVFPTGDYKGIFVCQTGDEYVGFLHVVFSVVSANKDTFG